MKVQARVLRTIDKVGGLDEYLLGNKPARIKELGMEGWRLRWKVMRTPKIQERLKEERKSLSLPAKGWREPRKVEEEVERVKGAIMEEIAADGKEEEDSHMEEDEPEDMVLDDAAAKEASSKNMKIPRLMSVKSKPEEQQDDDNESTAQDTTGARSPDIVQANDRRTLTGKAFGKLRGLLGR